MICSLGMISFRSDLVDTLEIVDTVSSAVESQWFPVADACVPEPWAAVSESGSRIELPDDAYSDALVAQVFPAELCRSDAEGPRGGSVG